MTISLGNVVAKACADALDDLVNAGSPPGSIKIYSSTVPTDNDTALGAQVLLATLVLSNPAFGTATDANPGGRITAGAITSDAAADATGTATFARICNAAGVSVAQFTVGTTGTDIIFNTVAFQIGAEIAISSLTITQPE